MKIVIKRAAEEKMLKKVLPRIKELKNTIAKQRLIGGAAAQQQTLTMCGTCQ